MLTVHIPVCKSVDIVKLPFELVTEEPTLSEQRFIKENDMKLAEPDKNKGTSKVGL